MSLKARQKIGKYRLTRRLASGGFAVVFVAQDLVEGIPVAVKVPHEHLLRPQVLQDFQREVRIISKLDHPNILSIKTADKIDGHLVIVTALGIETLADRMRRRLSIDTILDYAEQLLAGLACAHRKRVVHCDVKPENLILFGDNRLRLADFGIARVASRTVRASGSGTVGYMAPEQAMGKTSLRSDVFSAGLIIYRMISGTLPEWPFKWPYPGFDKASRRVGPELLAVLRKATQVDAGRRFASASELLRAFERARNRDRRTQRPTRANAPIRANGSRRAPRG